MRSARLPRRLLLCLLLLALAAPCFAQVAAQILASDGNLYGATAGEFYSINPATGQQTVLNASAPEYGLTVCLERSDGTLLAIGSDAAQVWKAFDITLAGAITTIAEFPASVTDSPVCPALANDGNYYGASSENGDYGHGFIYQLTAAGQINIFYNFTGGPDGTGPGTPLQASDGNLYWYNNNLLLRYSPAAGLTVFTLPYYGAGETLIEASDGNFYAPADLGIAQITPKGAATIIYTPPAADDGAETPTVNGLYLTGNAAQPLALLSSYSYTNVDQEDGCTANGNYFQMQPLSLSGEIGEKDYFDIGMDEYVGEGYAGSANGDEYGEALLQGGNGNFYAEISDYNQQDSGEVFVGCTDITTYSTYNQTFSAAGSAQILMSLKQTHVKPGGSATLTWKVNNAYSDTMQQCFGFGGLAGKVALSGAATVTAPSAGTYVSSIVCGGTETGIASLVAGDATLSLSSSLTQVNQGSPVTLTATITNAATPLPTGKVSFLVGSTVVGTATLSNGVAILTASTAGVPAGTYKTVASYAGDSNYGPAAASVNITVIGKSPTSTALAPKSQAVSQGANVSLTAKVVGSSTHGAPTGSVKFLVGTTIVGTVALSGENSTTAEATLTASTASIAAGTYSVTASYAGDSNNLASNSNAVTVTVSPATAVTLAISPNPVPADTSFMLTATIHGKDSPSGTVFFYVNGTQDLTSGNVSNGVATVTVPAGTLASGTYQMTATYAGDANNPTGTSPAVSLIVQ